MTFIELENIMEARGITALADIARALDTTPQAVSNWKSRDQVPYHVVAKLNNITDYTLPRSDERSIYATPVLKEDTISLSDILMIVARQIKTIIVISFVTVFLAFLYVQFINKENLLYISSTKILMSTPSPQSGLGGLASQFGVNFGAPKPEPEWIYPEILRSRTLARSMLKRKFDTIEFGINKTLLQILMDENFYQTLP